MASGSWPWGLPRGCPVCSGPILPSASLGSKAPGEATVGFLQPGGKAPTRRPSGFRSGGLAPAAWPPLFLTFPI